MDPCAGIPHAVQELDRAPRVRALGEMRDDADEGVDADATGDENQFAKGL